MKMYYQAFDGSTGDYDTHLGWADTLMFLLLYRGDIDKAWFDTDLADPTRQQYERKDRLEWNPGLICECDAMKDDMDFGLVMLNSNGDPCYKKNGCYEPFDYCPHCKMWVSRYDNRAKPMSKMEHYVEADISRILFRHPALNYPQHKVGGL